MFRIRSGGGRAPAYYPLPRMNATEPTAPRAERRERARVRRAAREDVILGSVIALLVLLVVDPGLGVVAFIAIPVLLTAAVWVLVKRAMPRGRRVRRPQRPTRA
jgi:hypothetical protein